MASLNERRCHVAFLDGRGAGLQEKIVEINKGEYLEARVHNGATFHSLSRLASAHLGSYPFDVVYIAGGACDVTTKDFDSGRISFDWNPPIVEQISGKIVGLTIKASKLPELYI